MALTTFAAQGYCRFNGVVKGQKRAGFKPAPMRIPALEFFRLPMDLPL